MLDAPTTTIVGTGLAPPRRDKLGPYIQNASDVLLSEVPHHAAQGEAKNLIAEFGTVPTIIG